jgi:uncharacterized protein YegJ (DUF2314 family)
MSDEIVFYSKEDHPEMIQAFIEAQKTFKYFWRELSWEYRRIIPALDVACVKVAFEETIDDTEEKLVEHMWINEIEFDGITISGVLINNPNELTNVQHGDFVQIPLTQISDWLFSTRGKTYGGFTIQALRSTMSNQERKEHDEAWQLDFGDFTHILLVYEQKEHPQNLIEHPMSVNMKPSLIEFLQTTPSELTYKDERGYTLLHKETIAGNKTSVEALLEAGALIDDQTITGHTALDFAIQLNWEHIIPLLKK